MVTVPAWCWPYSYGWMGPPRIVGNFWKICLPELDAFFRENTTPNSLRQGGHPRTIAIEVAVRNSPQFPTKRDRAPWEAAFGIIYVYLLPFIVFLGGQRKKNTQNSHPIPMVSKANYSTPQLKPTWPKKEAYKSLLYLLNFRGRSINVESKC